MTLYDRLKKIYDWTSRSKSLLDVGCDRGDITRYFKKKARKVYGADNNPDAIKYAKKTHKGVNFVLVKEEGLPFKNSQFNTVIMGDVLEHVTDEKKTLSEVHRVLSKNGTLILSVPHKGLFRVIDTFNMKFYFPKLYKWWKGDNFNPDIYDIQPWHRHYSLDDLKRLFGSKFKITRVHRGGLLIYPLAWLFGDMITDLFGDKLQFVRKIMTLSSHIDYNIPYGSLSYAIIIKAKKI